MPRSVALDTKTYAKAFSSCTGFPLKSSESQEVCKLCSLELIAAYRFIEKCRQTQETVDKWQEHSEIEQVDVKVEIDEDMKDESVSPEVLMKEENDETVTEMDDDDDLMSETSVKDDSPMTKSHCCAYCSAHYSSFHSLRRHLKKKHAKPINCDNCNIICKTSSAMDNHMRQIHPEIPIELPCNTCSHIFKSYSDRERSSHKCSQQFLCVTCEKTFADRHNLTLHESIHRDERSHVCHICGATFKTGPNLRQHLVGHRQDSNYECRMCDMAFKRRLGLQMHMTKKHPQDKMPARGEILNKNCKKRFLERNLKKVGNVRNVDKKFLETIGGLE
ncbi:zinc finger protein 596-like [Culicoides brevitarsis]|uniref:zinc finger protein 596-like n=1 Tax=Culicoides brevitarsis TaxID=469753 RepID=UPI00307BC9FE